MLAVCSPSGRETPGLGQIGSRQNAPLAGTVVYGCAKLQALLAGSRDLVQRRLNQSATIAIFCLELKYLLEQLILRSQIASSSVLPSKIPPAAYYTRLMDDITALGWEHVAAKGRTDFYRDESRVGREGEVIRDEVGEYSQDAVQCGRRRSHVGGRGT